MHVKVLMLAFLLFVSVNSFAQQLRGSSEEDQVNFRVIREGIKFLQSRPQPEKIEKNTSVIPASWNIYDTFIQTFYDVDYRRDSSEGYDTGFLHPSFQKLLLYNIDLYLDILPLDSITVTHQTETGFEPGSPASRLQIYSIGYLINGKTAIATILSFTQANKLLLIEPFIDFNHLNEGIDIEGFHQRHGFDKIKDRRYKFEASCSEEPKKD